MRPRWRGRTRGRRTNASSRACRPPGGRHADEGPGTASWMGQRQALPETAVTSVGRPRQPQPPKAWQFACRPSDGRHARRPGCNPTESAAHHNRPDVDAAGTCACRPLNGRHASASDMAGGQPTTPAKRRQPQTDALSRASRPPGGRHARMRGQHAHQPTNPSNPYAAPTPRRCGPLNGRHARHMTGQAGGHRPPTTRPPATWGVIGCGAGGQRCGVRGRWAAVQASRTSGVGRLRCRSVGWVGSVNKPQTGCEP
jgi:hypothetical protein